MKAVLFLSAFFVMQTNALSDQEKVTLPCELVLEKRLAPIDPQFLASERIVTKFAEQEVYPLAVARAFDPLCYQYLNSSSEPRLLGSEAREQKRKVADALYAQRPIFIEACLRDHPQALKKLKELGVYKPVTAKL